VQACHTLHWPKPTMRNRVMAKLSILPLTCYAAEDLQIKNYNKRKGSYELALSDFRRRIEHIGLREFLAERRRVADSLKFAHANTELFSLWFLGRVAVGMPSCKPSNRIACASSVEQRGRVLRGSDRSAKSELAPNCRLAQAM
jgi:hypothetical protein